MINSELSTDVSPDLNPKTMRLYDTSTYYVDEVISNYLLEILPVGKSKWETYNITKHFSLTLNSSNLRYNKVTSAAGLIDLPDGIYEIKQSYRPNEKTVVHYYHLRTVSITRSILLQKEKLMSKKCDLSRQEYVSERDKLRDIEEYVTAAKWMVEENLDKEKGKEMYEFAVKLIEKYTNECKCR